MTENEQKVRLRYRKNGVTQILELRGDWADICNEVRKRLYPGVEIEHHAITKRRKK